MRASDKYKAAGRELEPDDSKTREIAASNRTAQEGRSSTENGNRDEQEGGQAGAGQAIENETGGGGAEGKENVEGEISALAPGRVVEKAESILEEVHLCIYFVARVVLRKYIRFRGEVLAIC